MRLEKGFVQANRASLFYEERAEGFPLILIHAGIADHRMWDLQVDDFSQYYRVLRYDMRGFGQSMLPGGAYSNENDLAELMDQLELAKAHVVGISYGGLVAIEFALAFPDRVGKLILAAPSISGDAPSKRIIKFWEEEDVALEMGDIEAATELNLRLWVDGPTRSPNQVDPNIRRQIAEMQMEIFRIPVPEDVDILPNGAPAVNRLDEILLETLVLVGDLDLEEKLDVADRLDRELPNSCKKIISGAAHMLNMEKPGEFNQAVLDFLGGVNL